MKAKSVALLCIRVLVGIFIFVVNAILFDYPKSCPLWMTLPWTMIWCCYGLYYCWWSIRQTKEPR